ncbi:hypothetical protein GE09DRAFT_519899 [Coniochaeta sp. 2T2.1]|nr:hypothetical protein GE09DRAFT_519899 [Coniochaeta sp. 2T2.1]
MSVWKHTPLKQHQPFAPPQQRHVDNILQACQIAGRSIIKLTFISAPAGNMAIPRHVSDTPKDLRASQTTTPGLSNGALAVVAVFSSVLGAVLIAWLCLWLTRRRQHTHEIPAIVSREESLYDYHRTKIARECIVPSGGSSSGVKNTTATANIPGLSLSREAGTDKEAQTDSPRGSPTNVMPPPHELLRKARSLKMESQGAVSPSVRSLGSRSVCVPTSPSDRQAVSHHRSISIWTSYPESLPRRDSTMSIRDPFPSTVSRQSSYVGFIDSPNNFSQIIVDRARHPRVDPQPSTTTATVLRGSDTGISTRTGSRTSEIIDPAMLSECVSSGKRDYRLSQQHMGRHGSGKGYRRASKDHPRLIGITRSGFSFGVVESPQRGYRQSSWINKDILHGPEVKTQGQKRPKPVARGNLPWYSSVASRTRSVMPAAHHWQQRYQATHSTQSQPYYDSQLCGQYGISARLSQPQQQYNAQRQLYLLLPPQPALFSGNAVAAPMGGQYCNTAGLLHRGNEIENTLHRSLPVRQPTYGSHRARTSTDHALIEILESTEKRLMEGRPTKSLL